MADTLSFTQIMESLQARAVYGKALVELGESNPNVVVLTADLMRSNKTGDFKKAFPDRFFNFGIAEQNMMSAAAGMALMGLVPFATTFATFATMRACEQLRTDLCYMDLNVKVVGTHSGFSSGGGATHSSLEDISITRAMPNMTVVCPSDPVMIGDAVKALAEKPGPAYLRIGRGSEPVIYPEGKPFVLGKAIQARPGTDAAVIACGNCVKSALVAADALAAEGVSVRVVDMHTIKPLDIDAVLDAAKTGVVVTVVDHTVIGGLGSAVAEVLVEAGATCKCKRLGVPDLFPVFGSTRQIQAHYGYDDKGIASTVRTLLEEK